ncbi:Aste57867_6910 [Aphanomyces stellatus]|uniref:Aste57867_6910 protein n=1 Tax=Aphanomyces stellatus TaxID=120398 RepID=A0A485KHY2_9STRA|nr:hypothetical protein As57867_006888 [Aphanomyces stellatus]VFT83862.1 Aste57867_6910 [Aphanomyces stellatus]
MVTPTGLAHLGHPSKYPNLRCVCVGGEAISSALKDLWCPHVCLINAFGPSECAIATHLARLTREDPVTIGAPIDNVSCYALDSTQRMVPVGVVGELYLGGLCVSERYINLPTESADRFVVDPCRGGRMFRSGDLGRLLPNGRFEIVGRQDSQVKLKGYRIELDEVAHAMLQHPGVVAAAAIVQDKTHLVGFFSPATVTVEALQATVALHLPVYMVPAAWVGLDALPENANGKIDKHALGRLDQDTVDVQPLATAIETRLAAAWAHVLGIELDTIGRRASFLALGGDSITAIRLVAKAKQAGLAITSANVMKHPMLQQMAHTATPIVVARDAAPVAGSVPLTPIQHWILNLPWQNVHFWNLSLVKQARGLTFDQVHNAVARLQGHHDMLRARFSVDAGTWSQVVLEASDAANVAFVDLPDNLADVMAQTERSLHLFHGPVYAVTVYSVPDSTTQVLQLSLHHAIVDLVSWRILLEDLQLLLVDSQASLGPKTTSFQAWSQALSRQALVWDPRGWDAYMGNDVVPPPDRRGERLHRERVALGATARLVAANATYGTNIQELALVALTGAWRDMLANAGDNDRKLLLTMEGHGRDAWTSDLDVSSTVGWFTCDYVTLQRKLWNEYMLEPLIYN